MQQNGDVAKLKTPARKTIVFAFQPAEKGKEFALCYRTERIVVMGKAKLILGLAVLALAGVAGWRIASCELANVELHEDMRDLAAQIGSRIGLTPQSTDEDFRRAVIRKAEEHEIHLEPEQVTVQRTGTDEAPIIYLAADYKVRVKLLGFSFTFHFTPSSNQRFTTSREASAAGRLRPNALTAKVGSGTNCLTFSPVGTRSNENQVKYKMQWGLP